MSSPLRRTLRAYQQAALGELRSTWQVGHPRVTLSLPCGTGKTVVMAELLASGEFHRTVVFVPTVRLLVQTANLLRGARPNTRLIVVCSGQAATDDDFTDPEGACEPDLEPGAAARALGVEVTTDPDRLTELLSTSPDVLMVATYASSAVVAEATIAAARPWDLLICDEAHHTAGTTDKAWALPLSEQALPAGRRLFATATVRAVAPPEDTDPELGPIEVLSMSSVADYGPLVAPLSLRAAITARALSDYRVATIAVSEPAALELIESDDTDPNLDPQSAAAQLALMRAADTNPDLRSVMVFHNRIATSRAWAAQFRTLAKASGKRVRVYHVDGASDPRHVAAALGALAQPGGDLVVVSNCRLLSEGVDVPALDAVMFGAPRTGGPDIVQIIGRALRPHPAGQHRPALIILPVLHRPHDTASTEDRVARTPYLAAWQVLTVLAEEDEMVFRSLAEHRRHLEGDAPEPGPDNRVRFDTVGLPANLEDAFALQVVRRTTSGWIRVHHKLREQALRGNTVNPRPSLVVPDPNNPRGYPLGQRVVSLRKAHAAGRIPARIVALFDDDPLLADWSWNPQTGRTPTLSTDMKIALVERYVSLTRIPHIPPSATVTDPDLRRPVKIGSWIATLTPRSLTPEQRTRLAQLLPAQFGNQN